MDEYVRYGEEWKKEMMRNKKEDIVRMFSEAMKEKEEYVKQKRAKLQADIKFLAKRQAKASSISFGDTQRDTGISSNSIVSIAYGIIPIGRQQLPSDWADMMACERMWEKLPKHRKTGRGLAAMENARNCDYHGKELATDK